MNLLFSYTGPIKTHDYKEYFARSVSNEVLDRYYDISDKVTMITRVDLETESEARKYSKLTKQNLIIKEVPNIFSAKGFIFYRNQIKDIIKKEVSNADLVIVRLPCLIGNIVIEESIRQNKPYLIELVGCAWDSMWNHSLKGKIMAPYLFLKTKNKVRRADYVLYVTNEFLQNRYPTTGKETNCSNVMLQEENESILESRLNKINQRKNSDKLILGTAAALDVRYKGQQYVIKAIGKIKEKYGETNIEYQLIGNGDPSYLKRIAKKYNVENQVKIVGTLPHEEVFNWLDKIDLYVQPSKQEGLPRALIEAMSRGTPAFGSNTAGIPELLEDEFIFNRSKDRTREIIKIINSFNKPLMKNQAIRNYNIAKNYSQDIIHNRRKKFFEEFKKNSLKKVKECRK